MKKNQPLTDFKTQILKSLASLEVAIGSLVFLMVLIVMCTLEQVDLGTFGAVDKYFRSAFLYYGSVPVFPAGGIVGLVLLLNVLGSMALQLRRDKSKTGIWLIHSGLVVLVLGEFVTGTFAIESQLAVEEGQSMNFSVSTRLNELAIFDRSDQKLETVYSLKTKTLRKNKEIERSEWPFKLRIQEFHPNAMAGPRPPGLAFPSRATRGPGKEMLLRRQTATSRDDRRNLPAAFIEVIENGNVLGTWMVWAGLEGIQEFTVGGKKFAMQMRPVRRYLPFTVTLKDFSHDRYAGTNIPKNFSSLDRLQNPATGEDREVLIYMNNPLRYLGRTFYQSSFGKNDTLSVLQVVENPGWLLPYISFVVMALGLMVHFGLMITKFKPASGASS